MSEQRAHKAIRSLTESAVRNRRLRTLTNAELADQLEGEVWAHLDLYTPASEMVGQTIDRLRRSGGGALEEK